jgi:hypothetical protein
VIPFVSRYFNIKSRRFARYFFVKFKYYKFPLETPPLLPICVLAEPVTAMANLLVAQQAAPPSA